MKPRFFWLVLLATAGMWLGGFGWLAAACALVLDAPWEVGPTVRAGASGTLGAGLAVGLLAIPEG